MKNNNFQLNCFDRNCLEADSRKSLKASKKDFRLNLQFYLKKRKKKHLKFSFFFHGYEFCSKKVLLKSKSFLFSGDDYFQNKTVSRAPLTKVFFFLIHAIKT
jgi:hypothetical protein